jgi:GH15 family glucan-1,4-alpha-glucosidase
MHRFDHASCFARLIDHDRGVHFSIRPRQSIVARSRRYRDASMVLETTMSSRSGTMCVTDAFAVRRGGSRDSTSTLLRAVECVDGEIEILVEIAPCFDYGAARPWIRSYDSVTHSALAGDDALVIQSDLRLEIDRSAGMLAGRVMLHLGERFTVAVIAERSHELDLSRVDSGQALDGTVRWWCDWSERTRCVGPYAGVVERSALVLKSLCCATTGAIVAAPTTSLPEIAGGTANWDYRACWIRDASLTLEALSVVGHGEVASGFRQFLMRSAAGHADELQIMYGTFGERRLTELELDLEGWRHSRPVRVGNAASSQLQLDLFGHLIDAVRWWDLKAQRIDDDEWRFLRSVVDRAGELWDRADAGVWEERGDPKHYVHSKVMVWVAIDRGIRLAERREEGGPWLDRWRALRSNIRAAVDQRGVHPEGHFRRAFDDDGVDASLLKLALVGFVPADDVRMVRTVEVIQRELADRHGFIRRYGADGGSTVDGSREGVFVLCTLWLVEVLAMQGRVPEATRLFERVVSIGNDVGLFAEEYDATTGEFLGNFPQAYTHLGLISAANRLHEAHSAGGDRR